MSKPKILIKWVYFVPKGTTSAQDGVIPTVSDADKIGTVLTISGAREYEEAIFETPKGGKWVDRLAVNQRQRKVLSITCNELTPLCHSLVDALGTTTYANGTNTGVPGAEVTKLGWLVIKTYDESDVLQTTQSYWVKLDLPSDELPQTGYVPVTFTARVLDSTTQSASYVNNY